MKWFNRTFMFPREKAYLFICLFILCLMIPCILYIFSDIHAVVANSIKVFELILSKYKHFLQRCDLLRFIIKLFKLICFYFSSLFWCDPIKGDKYDEMCPMESLCCCCCLFRSVYLN